MTAGATGAALKLKEYEITATIRIREITPEPAPPEPPPVEPPTPTDPTEPVEIKRLTSRPEPQVAHTDSGWSTGQINRREIAILWSGKAFAYDIYQETYVLLPDRVGYGGQVQQTLAGEYLSITHDGKLQANGKTLHEFPKHPGHNMFRILHNSTGVLGNRIWVSNRSHPASDVGDWQRPDWYAGFVDLDIGQGEWRPAAEWMPGAVGHVPGRWHEAHQDAGLGIFNPERADSSTYRNFWFANGHSIPQLEGAHPAFHEGDRIFHDWDASANAQRIQATWFQSDWLVRDELFNHYHILGDGWWCGSVYEMDQQTLKAIRVFKGEELIKEIPAQRHPLREHFYSHARPFLARMEDGLRVFWHSDIDNEPGNVDIYTALV